MAVTSYNQVKGSSLEQLQRTDYLALLTPLRLLCPFIFYSNKTLFVLDLRVKVLILLSLKSNNLGIYFSNPFHLKRELNYHQQWEGLGQALLCIFRSIFVLVQTQVISFIFFFPLQK